MKDHSLRPKLGATALTLVAVALGMAGCASGPLAGPPIGPRYKPSNIYCQTAKFPLHIRKVALLPVSWEKGDSEAEAGSEQAQSLLQDELAKTKIFQVILVDREDLRRWTGRETWAAEDKLPLPLFGRLREESGCDAVLFCRLRSYHAYKPLVVGWHFELVDLQERTVVWSADEVFDAGEPDVARAAQHYYSGHAGEGRGAGDTAVVLGSPRRFAQYTLSALLSTLPER